MQLVLYACFLSLMLIMFLIKWFVTLNVYPIEPVDEFFQRICKESTDLVLFLDPIHQIRDCRLSGKVVDALQDDEYWHEGRMIKLTHLCRDLNQPCEDDNSKNHFNFCPSYKPPFKLKCPGDLVFDEYEKDCIYANSCFNEEKENKIAFNTNDFNRNFLTKIKLADHELMYFVCNGKNKIAKYGICPSDMIFDPFVHKDCVQNTDSCLGQADGAVHHDRVTMKGTVVIPNEFEYFICKGNKSILKESPPGQFFNVDRNQCQKIDRCKGMTDKTLFSHESDNRMFYECINQEECTRLCAENLVFTGNHCE